MPDADARLARSREDLRAARVLANEGLTAQAVSRAYFAAFYAATEALDALGETRSKHSGVLAAFGERVVREGGVAADVGRLIRSLFERRNDADYGPGDVTSEAAVQALADAERFVVAVEDWLGTRAGRAP